MSLIQGLSDTINPNSTVPGDLRNGGDLNNLADQLIGNVINYIIMPVGGVVAVVSLVYGGYLYITAGGDVEKTQKGKRVIIYSVIAIVIVMLSFVIYNTILDCVNPGPAGTTKFLCPNRP